MVFRMAVSIGENMTNKIANWDNLTQEQRNTLDISSPFNHIPILNIFYLTRSAAFSRRRSPGPWFDRVD